MTTLNKARKLHNLGEQYIADYNFVTDDSGAPYPRTLFLNDAAGKSTDYPVIEDQEGALAKVNEHYQEVMLALVKTLFPNLAEGEQENLYADIFEQTREIASSSRLSRGFSFGFVVERIALSKAKNHGGIGITITDGAGEVHELTDTEVYELRLIVGVAIEAGMFEDIGATENLFRMLAPPCRSQGGEEAEDFMPRTESEVEAAIGSPMASRHSAFFGHPARHA